MISYFGVRAMLQYILVEEEITNEDIGTYTSYGIELRYGEEIIDRISDIDTDREGVENLCKLCNKLKLSPIHLKDVVEDYLDK